MEDRYAILVQKRPHMIDYTLPQPLQGGNHHRGDIDRHGLGQSEGKVRLLDILSSYDTA
jgi:hypothetical protein